MSLLDRGDARRALRNSVPGNLMLDTAVVLTNLNFGRQDDVGARYRVINHFRHNTGVKAIRATALQNLIIAAQWTKCCHSDRIFLHDHPLRPAFFNFYTRGCYANPLLTMTLRARTSSTNTFDSAIFAVAETTTAITFLRASRRRKIFAEMLRKT